MIIGMAYISNIFLWGDQCPLGRGPQMVQAIWFACEYKTKPCRANHWNTNNTSNWEMIYVIEENYVHFIVKKLLACRVSVLHGARNHDI